MSLGGSNWVERLMRDERWDLGKIDTMAGAGSGRLYIAQSCNSVDIGWSGPIAE